MKELACMKVMHTWILALNWSKSWQNIFNLCRWLLKWNVEKRVCLTHSFLETSNVFIHSSTSELEKDKVEGPYERKGKAKYMHAIMRVACTLLQAIPYSNKWVSYGTYFIPLATLGAGPTQGW